MAFLEYDIFSLKRVVNSKRKWNFMFLWHPQSVSMSTDRLAILPQMEGCFATNSTRELLDANGASQKRMNI